MKKVLFLIALSILCSITLLGQRKGSTIPVTMEYALPKISYEFVITMEYAKLIPGPFAQYAQAQLGVRPEIMKEGEEWTITDIKVIPKPIPDANAIFRITAVGDYTATLLNITPEGFLAGINSENFNQVPEEKVIYKDNIINDEGINYVNFGIRSTQKEVLDSNFTTLEVEGELRQVWDPIERYVLKDKEEYIQEITEEIFNIRERKLELLSGPATEIALREITKLEEDYLSLFMGKKVKSVVVQTITYTPEKANESKALFRFSKQQGISEKGNVTMTPYIVELKNLIVPQDNTPEVTGKQQVVSISYRAPAVADLNLLRGEEIVLSMRAIIPQLGVIKQFPIDMIRTEGVYVDFYPQYGSIKGVIKK